MSDEDSDKTTPSDGGGHDDVAAAAASGASTDSASDSAADDHPVAEDQPATDPFEGEKWAGQDLLGTSRRRRRSNQKRPRRKLSRRTKVLFLLVAGLILVTAAWLAVTGLLAQKKLTAMKSGLSTLRTEIGDGDVTAANATAKQLAADAGKAHSLTTGPAWWTVAHIPWFGEPLKTVRGIGQAADALSTTTLPKLITVSAAVDPSKLSLKNHALNLGPLLAAAPDLSSAVQSADQQLANVQALPANTWLGSVNTGVTSLGASLTKLDASLHSIQQAVSIAPTMLGYTAPQRYFVGFQNEAELRGTGGLPGAFGILLVDHGTFTFTHFGSDSELEGVGTDLDFGADYDQSWHDFEPTTQYLNSDVDPDFSYAGQLWAAMWQKKSGEHINGALSLDPNALGYFLGATGSTKLADGTELTADNIVALTERDAYAKFTDETKRKAFLLDIAEKADERIVGASGDATALFKAAKRSAGERRLLLWDEAADVEKILGGAQIGGTVSATTGPYVQPVLINYGANKLDYYLKRDVSWTSKGCGDTRDVTVVINLTNSAPASLPAYVTGRSDDPPYPTSPGDNRSLLYYVASAGGSLEQMTVDGKVTGVTPGIEGSHPTYSALIEIPRGKTVQIVMQLQEPHSSRAVTTVQQPMVQTSTPIQTSQQVC